MVNIVNAGRLGGGFRHYAGLLPVNPGDGDVNNASVRVFHIPSANAAAIFRGDIVVMASGAIGTPGGADLPTCFLLFPLPEPPYGWSTAFLARPDVVG